MRELPSIAFFDEKSQHLSTKLFQFDTINKDFLTHKCKNNPKKHIKQPQNTTMSSIDTVLTLKNYRKTLIAHRSSLKTQLKGIFFQKNE